MVADIEFVKPCLFKGRIESEAWSGMKKYYELVEIEVQLEKKQDQSEVEDDEELVMVRKSQSLDRRLLLNSESGLNIMTSQPVFIAALVMIVLTLFMLTLALFKLNSALVQIDQRLAKVEQIIESNSKFFELFMDEKLKDL